MSEFTARYNPEGGQKEEQRNTTNEISYPEAKEKKRVVIEIPETEVRKHLPTIEQTVKGNHTPHIRLEELGLYAKEKPLRLEIDSDMAALNPEDILLDYVMGGKTDLKKAA